MIFRDIFYREPFMLTTKALNSFPFMPSCMVNPQFNMYARDAAEQLLKKRQKSGCVASMRFHHSMPAAHWINPAKHIQPLLVLAFCRNSWLCSLFAPHPAQFRMY